MTDTYIYAIQIAALVVCIGLFSVSGVMIWRSRPAMNGLARGLLMLITLLIMLMILLVVRRLDSIYGLFDSTIVLSSVIVFTAFSIAVIFTYDIWQIYKAREVYALYLRNRQRRIEELETLIKHDTRLWSD